MLDAAINIKPYGLEFLILVNKSCTNDLAITQKTAIPVDFLIDQVKAVTLTDVENEIDIPAKQVRQFHHHVVTQPCLLSGQKQGGGDGAAGFRGFRDHVARFGACNGLLSIVINDQVMGFIYGITHAFE